MLEPAQDMSSDSATVEKKRIMPHSPTSSVPPSIKQEPLLLQDPIPKVSPESPSLVTNGLSKKRKLGGGSVRSMSPGLTQSVAPQDWSHLKVLIDLFHHQQQNALAAKDREIEELQSTLRCMQSTGSFCGHRNEVSAQDQETIILPKTNQFLHKENTDQQLSTQCKANADQEKQYLTAWKLARDLETQLDTVVEDLKQAREELALERRMNKREEYDQLMGILRTTMSLPAIGAIAATNSFGDASIHLRKLSSIVFEEQGDDRNATDAAVAKEIVGGGVV
jgi:hypothetical protein